MARPKKPYTLIKRPYKNKKTGERKRVGNYTIVFKDHLQIERRLSGKPDKKTTEYIADNIIDIVNNKRCNQALTPEQRTFIQTRPKIIRQKLLDWNILDANTNAGFEPLMISKKVNIKHAKNKKHEVSGGHVYHWQKSMEANERSKQHIKESVSKVAKVIEGCDFIVPSDINGEKFKNWLADLRKQGKTISNTNSHLTSFKAFNLWLLRTGRLSENPIRDITPLKKVEKERPRRPLPQKQVNELITATVEADKHHGLTGYERSLVYRLALGTGLRYNEIYTLNRMDIVTKELKVNVQAGNAKNRKWDTLPLTEELAKELEQYFSANLGMPHTKAFSGMWKDAGAAMLKPDLKLAGIEYQTEDGVVDFHSLRHTFGTLLARSGVSLQDAQKLMRHSDVNLTAGIYTHKNLGDKAAAINKLPPIEIQKKKLAKTGTADIPENHCTGNCTENPIKIQQYPVKSPMMGFLRKQDIENVTPCKTKELQRIEVTRPPRFEHGTYGLEIRPRLL